MRSHTKEEILQAQANELPVWQLDTGNDGMDDVLIGGTEEDARHDVMAWANVTEWPDHWSLTKIDWGI